ncbi:TetR/AcrR family transcriptional regulator [Streptomyces tanashiensis]|uniref:TetR/AcrR family transcriptional regulator n=1 Tax=Streptomyces tanashiensis TaxID=67367 RepID=A0ABY6R964_9ACTN|nr:TetR/AcrR family transcriptional regulator [Streptomyces tanashiensis]UZX26056.1 TetR/AcrR family transcriptional regulator [Streptomyces tanashiensis]
MAQDTPPVKRGRKRAVGEDEVVAAAMRLLGTRGADAVSIRGIAAELGLAPNAVYTYFPDRAAVVRAVVEYLLGETDLAALTTSDTPWRDRIHVLAADLRHRLLAHPGAVNLLLSGPMDGPHALAIGEALLMVLADAGLDPTQAARASYLLIVQVLGAIALEAAELPSPLPPPPIAERVATRREQLRAVPADRYPRTAEAADTIARFVSDEQYAWGIDRVLDGIAGRAKG